MTDNVLTQINALQSAVNHSILGQEKLVNALIIALLTNGNVLLEGLPGTAKTRSIRTLANVLEANLGRIQFTPDLLPSDVTGTEMFQDIDGKTNLAFKEGPIFNHLVLADEINRAPAKVQAALLEAMEERQVTVMGKSYPLPELFMVLATQNPIEQEGTYPLPEAQIDRFALKIKIDYPEDEQELAIIRLVRQEEAPTPSEQIKVSQETILQARKQVTQIHVSEVVENYIVAIVMATRKPERYPSSPLKDWIAVGSSPRASIMLDKCARAQAFLNGKDYVDPDDVRQIVADVLRHRISLSYEAQADGVTTDDVILEIIKQVAVI
tara:strand:+ start:3156 stop:4127 length:972 start_codon:yes stop_codon:yes gene_type:complete